MMETVIDQQLCTGCHACFNACPGHAIRMEEDEEGFLYPLIDQQLCVDCGKCRAICPVQHQPECNEREDTYACAAADGEVRLASSSGAVFALLASDILQKGGLVCGAAFDGPGRVKHIVIDDKSQLPRILGTKYVQSEIGSVYAEIGEALRSGRRVLFSGTGCQVAGLKNYLGQDPPELLTVDLICHGVPSPAVWRDYLRELGKESPVAEAEFRVRNANGKKTGFRYLLENGEEHCHEQKDDVYVKGFLQNLYLRSSCFSCAFKGTKRCSDLTIGDFWSAKEFHPALEDGLGVSAVLVHNEKGAAAFQRIAPAMKWEPATPSEAAYWNECLLRSVEPTDRRNAFFARWKREELLPLLREMTEQGTQHRAEKAVSRRDYCERLRGFLHKALYGA